jgi:hypothetical protein
MDLLHSSTKEILKKTNVHIIKKSNMCTAGPVNLWYKMYLGHSWDLRMFHSSRCEESLTSFPWPQISIYTKLNAPTISLCILIYLGWWARGQRWFGGGSRIPCRTVNRLHAGVAWHRHRRAGRISAGIATFQRDFLVQTIFCNPFVPFDSVHCDPVAWQLKDKGYSLVLMFKKWSTGKSVIINCFSD